MRINYKNFGIIKDKDFNELPHKEKMNKLVELNFFTKKQKLTLFKSSDDTIIRNQVTKHYAGKLNDLKEIYSLDENLKIEIKNYISKKYSHITSTPLLQFLNRFESEIFTLPLKKKRKIGSKYFKYYLKKMNSNYVPNLFSKNRNYLSCAYLDFSSNYNFLENNLELISNYLIGNESYFSDELLNDPIFDTFYDKESTFLIINHLNRLYNFEFFDVNLYNFKEVIKVNPNFKDIFKYQEIFLFFDSYLSHFEYNKQVAISLYYFLNSNKLILDNKKLFAKFLKVYYVLSISKITVKHETNDPHKIRMESINKNFDLFKQKYKTKTYF